MGHQHSEVEIARALLSVGPIHCPAPALSSALHQRSPHPAPGLFLRYACVLPRTVLALSAAIHWGSTMHCDSAFCCGAPELNIELRGHSMQAPSIFLLLRSSPPSFAGALPYTMPTLGHTTATRYNLRRGCSLGSRVVGWAMVPAAANELLCDIA